MAFHFKFTEEVDHPGLGKYRVISGTDRSIVSAKARALYATWEAEFQRKLAKQREISAREAKIDKIRRLKEHSKGEETSNRQKAEDLTADATSALEKLENVLIDSLLLTHKVDWDKLKRSDIFAKPKPLEPIYLVFPNEPREDDPKYRPPTENPTFLSFPEEPQADHPKYHAEVTVLDRVIWRAEKKAQASYAAYLEDHKSWEETVKAIDAENHRLFAAATQRDVEKQRTAKLLYDEDHAAWLEAMSRTEFENQKRYSQGVDAAKQWEAELQQHEQTQCNDNLAIDKRRMAYNALEKDAVSDCCEIALSASVYPDSFPKDFEIEYITNTKILVVDYSLPSPEQLPRVKEHKFVKTKNEIVEVFLSESELNRIYDNTTYRICLRTIYELFAADIANALNAVVFNGWVKSIDKASGKNVNNCVISIQAKKEEFQQISLANVDPKSCFKSLKGIGSSKLHSLTPVAPVLKLNREDKRFIAEREIENRLDEGFNLAAMDWEDFEQLVREIFEQEFAQNGGEVKVTQASRDGGVDAVVFDPDPIRGGKIVIQAKRYTNTVGVGFVRELWGTVLNEGAMKGILITTADYGPDAYEFAKGKPIVLMNGANLLYLLEKHGRKAKIDIAEAKKLLGERAN